MQMDLLEKKTAVEIGQLIEIGKICPLELTEFFLQKIEQFPESQSIFTTVLQERSLELAKESKSRANAGIRKSIIDGVPISIKDLADIRNELTKGGSLMIESEKAKSDAVFVTNATSGLIAVKTVEKKSFSDFSVVDSIQEDLISLSLDL